MKTIILMLVILSCTQAVDAQVLQTLYAFVSTNGCYPQAALTVGTDGNFYGTTPTGGTNGGYGTIFKVTTNGVLTSLFQFSVTNGAYPYAGLTLGSDGCLYGTTEYGGSNGKGTVFKVTTDGVFTSLASFNSTNGANPTAGLTLGSDGNFYGTTTYGGSDGYGTVFKMATNGVLTGLSSFTAANGFTYTYSSLGNPISGLIFGRDGAMYGTSAFGGSYMDGTVFRVTTNGSFTFLVSFYNGNGGTIYPSDLALGSDGNFYGTAYYGYNYNGSIFKVTPSGTLSTLYAFPKNNSGYWYANGASPKGSLIFGKDGWLYGTASGGGTNGPPYGNGGTIYKISMSGSFIPLASFDITNGGWPYAGLVMGNDGNFYGTTSGGGDCGQGAVFQFTTNGTLSEFAPFSGSIGCWPKAGLTIGNDGNFYGSTSGGGTNRGSGTLFKLSTNGDFTSLVSLSGGLHKLI